MLSSFFCFSSFLFCLFFLLGLTRHEFFSRHDFSFPINLGDCHFLVVGCWLFATFFCFLCFLFLF